MNGGLVFRDNGITSHMTQTTTNVASHAAAILEERIVRYALAQSLAAGRLLIIIITQSWPSGSC